MKARRLAEIGDISMRHAYYILNGSRRPSVALAKRLEAVTGVPAQAWLFPDRYPNIFLDKEKAEVIDSNQS